MRALYECHIVAYRHPPPCSSIPKFDPVAIHLGLLAVRWYGLKYSTASSIWVAGR